MILLFSSLRVRWSKASDYWSIKRNHSIGGGSVRNSRRVDLKRGAETVMGNILLSAVGTAIAIAIYMHPKRAEGAQEPDLKRRLKILRERALELERMSEQLKARLANFPRVFARNENLKIMTLERRQWVLEELKTLRQEQLRLLEERAARLKNTSGHKGSGRKP